MSAGLGGSDENGELSVAVPFAAIGTMNPGKHEACMRAFEKWPGDAYIIKGVATESGVSEQPMGLDQTVLGAQNRATSALHSVQGAELGIGLESGLVVMGGRHFDFCACALDDGKRQCVGISSMWPLPPQVVEAMSGGIGYNQAFEALGVPADDRGDGVLARLSSGILSRPKQMEESVHAALIQLRNVALYS